METATNDISGVGDFGEATGLGEASEPSALEDQDILASQGLVEMPTEAELMGEEQPDVNQKQASSEPDEAAEPEESEEEPDEKPEQKEDKTVPLQALHESRQKYSDLRGRFDEQAQQVTMLTQAIMQMQQQQQHPQGQPQVQQKEPDGFKKLSRDEYKELVEDDPDQAMQYMLDLQEHQEQQLSQQIKDFQESTRRDAQRQADENLITTSTDQISDLLPGITSDENVAAEFESFAIDTLGLTPEALELTNPKTLIYPEGASEPVFAGESAVKMMSGLVNAYKNWKSEAAIEQNLTQKIGSEFAKKLQKGESIQNVALSTDIPTATGQTPSQNMSVTDVLRKFGPDSKEFEQYMQG